VKIFGEKFGEDYLVKNIWWRLFGEEHLVENIW
jgi:hypothetical protein